ncbi:MAG: hypothetical protein OXG40_14495 [Acidimicrobiaceae bacterium]|nr:hypothetical protein [Acidimicrobiaceae bacterium]MDE0515131.1 hypothetical protein [Acidimicrobiaceae bacterium]
MPQYRAKNASHAQNDPNKVYEIEADDVYQAVDILIGWRYNAIGRADTRHEVKPESPNIPLQNVYIYSGDQLIEHWAVQDII